jgi:hypothetical protein
VVEVAPVVLVADALALLDPLVAGGEGVEAPVEEEAEACLGEPGGVAGGRRGHLGDHISHT